MKEEKYKIGILGGTFNPIHNGHLYLAKVAMEKAGLNCIMFIPSGISYMKDTSIILPAKDRLEMTRLAIGENPSYHVSSIEIDKGGNSYSFETIEALKNMYPECEFYFIIGADTLFHMEEWKKPEVIFAQTVILAAYRSGEQLDTCRRKIVQLKEKYNAKIDLIATDPVDISSTKIREAVKSGQSLDALVPHAVGEYILKNSFYRD